MSTTKEANLADIHIPATIGPTVTQPIEHPEHQLDPAAHSTQPITLPEESDPTSPVQRRQPKFCGVCTERESKYKCTRCELPYCSVACSVLHKASHADDIEVESPATLVPEHPPPPVANPQPGTITAAGARNPFAVLETSQELKTLFLMFPRLRSQLREIYSQTQEPNEESLADTSHIEEWQPSRGRGGGRGRGGRGRGRGPWTQERGTQDGIAAFRRAQQEYGKGGEGVREFEQLVLKLVTTRDQSHNGVDAAAIVQQEVAAENVRIISQLLNGEDH